MTQPAEQAVAAACAPAAEFAKTQPLETVGGGASAPAPGCTARRCDAVIVFTELRGLAPVAARLDPTDVLAMASEFWIWASRSVTDRGGEAVAMHHDALLSVFWRGSPAQTAQHAIRATQALQTGFARLAERWREAIGVRTALAQGVHLGDVVLGSGGPDGAERRFVFGDSVNLANRIVRRARAGEIVMSDALMGALAVENLQLDAEPLPALEIPRRQPLRIYGMLLDVRLDLG